MKNFSDIELLSSYLDGQLSPSESARMESRIASDPELESVYNDIRAARGILRKLPVRKAPRNFTLTRQMVRLKPPLPRCYSFFRFSTAFTAILLVFTFAANTLTQISPVSLGASAPMAAAPQGAYGIGGGPVATEPPMAAAPSVEMAIAPTEVPTLSADSSRIVGTPTAEAPTPKEAENASESQNQPQVRPESLIPVVWQIGLLAVGLISFLVMLALRQFAKQKWK